MTLHVRHDTRHADQGVDTTEGDRDAPKTCGANNALREGLVPRCEGEYSTIIVCVTFMNLSPRMIHQARVVNLETEAFEHCGDSHCRGLLTVHADGKCLYTTQKKEAVEWSEGITDRIDNERYLL
jgi:hypothetical protein